MRPVLRRGLRRSLVNAIGTGIGALVLALLLLEDPLVQFRFGELAREELDTALDAAVEQLDRGEDPDAVADLVSASHGVRITAARLDDRRIVGDSGYDGDRLAEAQSVLDSSSVDDFLSSGRQHRTVGEKHLAFRRWQDRLVLQATMSSAIVGRAHATIRELLVLGGIMAVLVAVFLTIALSRTLIEPARELTAVADSLASGDLTARTGSEREDELGAIGRALDRMAEELADRIASLRGEQDRLRTILDSMVEAVFVTDRLGRIELTNAALDALVSGDARGRTAMEVLRSSELRDAVRMARKGGPQQVEFELKHHDEVLSFSAELSPLADRGGVVAVLHDVTRLKEAERIRRDFVANASHELRTPLTAIRGFAETLRDGALQDRASATRFIDVILKHTLRLQALVADLTALSKAESPEHHLEIEVVDPESVIVEVIRGLASKADQRKVQMVFEPAGEQLFVVASERGLDQVMVNLVDNAIKYTPEGSAVRVRSIADAERVRIEVYNPGPGIPPEHLGRLFERFYRVDPGRGRDVGGTGLGLAIVKHLCSQMGAEVGVRSDVGQGATFFVSLPIASGDEEPSSDSDSRPPPELPVARA